jgi:hypothetical protein
MSGDDALDEAVLGGTRFPDGPRVTLFTLSPLVSLMAILNPNQDLTASVILTRFRILVLWMCDVLTAASV